MPKCLQSEVSPMDLFPITTYFTCMRYLDLDFSIIQVNIGPLIFVFSIVIYFLSVHHSALSRYAQSLTSSCRQYCMSSEIHSALTQCKHSSICYCSLKCRFKKKSGLADIALGQTENTKNISPTSPLKTHLRTVGLRRVLDRY